MAYGAAMDRLTLDFYEQHAAEWAAHLPHGYSPRLDHFFDRLPPGAAILELGCGDGREAARMIARGFEVHPSDGTPAMARLASERLGREVPVMDFGELDAVAAYDAVWCQASLLHLAEDELAPVLSRIHRALRPGGWHWASYKDGTGGGRDEAGRFFSYIPLARLEAAYRGAGGWSDLTIETAQGSAYFRGPTMWHGVLARK
jgi:SAM-dependent methyltransferase